MKHLSPQKIAVVYNLPTQNRVETRYLVTDEDTAESAQLIFEALSGKGHNVALVPVSDSSIAALKEIRADCIFNLIEWTGADMPLAIEAIEVLESLGIPYTGVTAKVYQITSDKYGMKQALDSAGLPTARWQYFQSGNEVIRNDFDYPVIVKLAAEHCSIGMNRDAVVSDRDALINRVRERIQTFASPVIVEEFITGREFQVTVLETGNDVRVLAPAEIVFHSSDPLEFLTYESRWDSDHPDYGASSVVMAKLSHKDLHAIETVTKATFKALELRDYARLDIRLRSGSVIILEANSNPGLDDSDEYGMTLSYKAAGMTFADFIEAIVASALRRAGRL